jgi:hypothetical protein
MTFYICIEDKVDSVEIDILSNPDMQTHDSLYSSTVEKNIAILEKPYLLQICTKVAIDTNNIQLPSSIILLTDWTASDNTYTATISFTHATTQDINISYSKTLYGVTNSVVSNTYSLQVYSIYDMVVEVRYNLLEIDSNGGVYTIYKKPDYIDTIHNVMTYVDFVTYLDPEKQLPFVDNVTSMVESQYLANNLFHADDFAVSTTPYTIDIYALGEKVNHILVQVCSVDISLQIKYDDTIDYIDTHTTIELNIVNNHDSHAY